MSPIPATKNDNVPCEDGFMRLSVCPTEHIILNETSIDLPCQMQNTVKPC
jgi:hypothetical protein